MYNVISYRFLHLMVSTTMCRMLAVPQAPQRCNKQLASYLGHSSGCHSHWTVLQCCRVSERNTRWVLVLSRRMVCTPSVNQITAVPRAVPTVCRSACAERVPASGEWYFCHVRWPLRVASGAEESTRHCQTAVIHVRWVHHSSRQYRHAVRQSKTGAAGYYWPRQLRCTRRSLDAASATTLHDFVKQMVKKVMF